MIDKTLNNGQLLIDQKHYASSSVLAKCKELEDSWKELLNCAAERKKKLELNLKSQSVSLSKTFCTDVCHEYKKRKGLMMAQTCIQTKTVSLSLHILF